MPAKKNRLEMRNETTAATTNKITRYADIILNDCIVVFLRP
jgi:hypothetical protein